MSQSNNNVKKPWYKIEGHDVSAAEFEAFLKGLHQTKYLWCEKATGGGTESYIAEDLQQRSYRIIVSSGKNNENRIDPK